MPDLKTKTQIDINGVYYDFELYQMDAGVINGFKFDNRIFLDVEKVKESIELFIQMSKSNFFDKQDEKVTEEEKPIEKPNDVWTKEADNTLRKVYPNMSAPDIVKSGVLPNRSEQAIYDRGKLSWGTKSKTHFHPLI